MLNENKEHQLRNVVNFNSVTAELCIKHPRGAFYRLEPVCRSAIHYGRRNLSYIKVVSPPPQLSYANERHGWHRSASPRLT